jgi:hypothetical protein
MSVQVPPVFVETCRGCQQQFVYPGCSRNGGLCDGCLDAQEQRMSVEGRTQSAPLYSDGENETGLLSDLFVIFCVFAPGFGLAWLLAATGVLPL